MRLAAMLVPLALAAGPARATPAEDESRVRFERAVGLMEAEDWEAAALEFARSLELHPTRNALFNLGMCRKALHEYVVALHLFEQWLERFAADAPASDTASVTAVMADLRGYIGTLTVAVDRPGATVRVDGVDAGTTPLPGPIDIEVGTHRVEVELPGFVAESRSPAVLSGQNVELAFVLVPRPAADPPNVPPPDDGSASGAAVADRGLDAVWFWTSLGTGVALGIAGGVTAGLVPGKEDEFDDLATRCQTDPEACRRARTVYDEGEALALATNVLLPVAGTVLAAAVVLAVFTEFGAAEAPPLVPLVAPGVGADGSPSAVLGMVLRF
jgi:hypothetical protein